MSPEAEELAELLARAAVIDDDAEVKAAAAVAEPAPAPTDDASLTPDALIDLVAQQAVAAVREEIVEELREVVEALRASSLPGEDATADAEAADDEDDGPMDFDQPDDDPLLGKGAFGPCPGCGSTGVDEFADGTAQCEDCGMAVGRVQHKGLDFDEDADELVDVLTVLEDDAPAEAKADTVEQLSELELLMARRASLDT